MKFYGNGVVWDGANQRRLCSFSNGIYETNDAREIAILKSIGFEHSEDYSDLSKNELWEIIKENNLDGKWTMSKSEMLKVVEENVRK